jgi:hypothetical protein
MPRKEGPATSLTNYLCGFAKIKLRHLSGEYRKKNMLRFKGALMGGRCSLLDPEHHITALINMNTLNKGLEKSGLNATTLVNAIDPPHLSLEGAVVLPCLRGRDLLEAIRRVLPPGQRWVVVKLYVDSMSSHASLSPTPDATLKVFLSFYAPKSLEVSPVLTENPMRRFLEPFYVNFRQ